VGWFFKNVFGGAPASATAPVMAAAPAASAAMAAAAKPAVAPVTPRAPMAPQVARPAVESAPVQTIRPKGIAVARDGKPDNLQRISGVGPKNELTLHELGIFHFDQIARWSEGELHWVDDHLKFHGRIIREEWVRQARLLADGKEDEFAREFGTGGLKGKDGQVHSGTHTRKH
jgi:predicted flap endonuclease-1-like 5' DNA nuclease